MRKLLMVCVASSMAALATAAWADGPSLGQAVEFGPPTPITPGDSAADDSLLPTETEVFTQPAPAGTPGMAPIPLATANVVELYSGVRYRRERNIAPCAVPMIVMVKDPCERPRCRTGKCVCVEICVPPCSTCPPRVCCRRGGEVVIYDFGKYRVDIVSRRGNVTVVYRD
ncbi:MAG: hypothetical protein EXS05_06285 [Planctomycetaceae bacterium]|nr:hypothetical protein [Planctomycetaceae bacterium]